MKKIIFIIFLLILFFSVETVQGFCCKDRATDQSKCYSTGECCDGYWYPSCHDFKIWLRPKRAVFITGKKTPINLYIENIGLYSDNYEITYSSTEPDKFLVDISYISSVKNVVPGEIRVINPRITVISATITGDIYFTVTSDSGSTKQETLNILESEMPMSLPEFDFFGLIGIIMLAGVIYFIVKRKH